MLKFKTTKMKENFAPENFQYGNICTPEATGDRAIFFIEHKMYRSACKEHQSERCSHSVWKMSLWTSSRTLADADEERLKWTKNVHVMHGPASMQCVIREIKVLFLVVRMEERNPICDSTLWKAADTLPRTTECNGKVARRDQEWWTRRWFYLRIRIESCILFLEGSVSVCAARLTRLSADRNSTVANYFWKTGHYFL